MRSTIEKKSPLGRRGGFYRQKPVAGPLDFGRYVTHFLARPDIPNRIVLDDLHWAFCEAWATNSPMVHQRFTITFAARRPGGQRRSPSVDKIVGEILALGFGSATRVDSEEAIEIAPMTPEASEALVASLPPEARERLEGFGRDLVDFLAQSAASRAASPPR